MVRDVNAGAGNGVDTIQPMLVDWDGQAIFWGYSPSGAPWLTDGTSAGTAKITATAGSWTAFENGSRYGVPVGGHFFYYAFDSFFGAELWSTDGTAAGTQRLTDIGVGADPAELKGMDAFGDRLVFSANDGFLRKSDGTVAGTTGAGGTAVGDEYVHAAGKLFVGCSTNFVNGICVSTGSTPVLLKQLQQVASLTAVNDRVFFAAGTNAEGRELWVTDGTAAGTVLVKDIAQGVIDSTPFALTRFDDRLVFRASDPINGTELWISDGTAAGTTLLGDAPGTAGAGGNPLAVVDGKLFFARFESAVGTELWITDGTSAGTRRVKDIRPGTGSSQPGVSRNVNGKFMFAATDGTSLFTQTLWASDGTDAGTVEIDPDVAPFGPFVPVNGKLLFPGTAGAAGREVFGLDTTPITGTRWCKSDGQVIPLQGQMTSHMLLPATVTLPTSVRVELDLAHQRAGDLKVTLTSPNGASIALLDRPGNGTCAGDLVDITLSDAAPTLAASSCASARLAYPRDASFRPAQPLAAVAGQPTGGLWTLTIDDVVASNAGTLHDWCIEMTVATPTTLLVDGFER